MVLRFCYYFLLASCCIFFTACEADEPFTVNPSGSGGTVTIDPEASVIAQVFGGRVNLADTYNYGSQETPGYIRRDNTGNNPITDEVATLGRVLFYDKALSSNQTISCASCHLQSRAFGDEAIASVGVAGTTGRHGMRLGNARFGSEVRFFWDERAQSLEEQTTQPIQDHVEMGFSGTNGDLTLNDLLTRLNGTDYYQELFTFAFGSPQVTEQRMQNALAQFIRSRQSLDSRYDEGRVQVNNDNAAFSNFSALENQGKSLFMGRPEIAAGGRIGGGLGCEACHQAPEFSIDPNSRNNGVTGTVTGIGTDFTVTRSPSLRDVFLPNGQNNGPFMHDGSLASINEVLSHYNNIPQNNPNLDRRLSPGGNPQRLNLTDQERGAVIAFMKTLSGSALYTDARWSDPF
jgi:cytochrome c peroxidase